MSHYTHLSIEEREKSRVMLEQGMSIRAIARILGRSPLPPFLVSLNVTLMPTALMPLIMLKKSILKENLTVAENLS